MKAAFWVWWHTCRCGDLLYAHRHYLGGGRPATYCGQAACECLRFRRRWRAS
jgi:hypothetical protein